MDQVMRNHGTRRESERIVRGLSARALEPVPCYGFTKSIGQLAQDAGVGIGTIRYYQRIGLVPEPQRAFNGWHRYPERTSQLLRHLRQGRQLGFSLREVGHLFSHSSAGAPRFCAAFRAAIEAKIAELDAEMERLQSHRAQLRDFAKSCREREHSGQCPMLDRLS
jgi:DNA-binding transcriptional MerR regulator